MNTPLRPIREQISLAATALTSRAGGLLPARGTLAPLCTREASRRYGNAIVLSAKNWQGLVIAIIRQGRTAWETRVAHGPVILGAARTTVSYARPFRRDTRDGMVYVDALRRKRARAHAAGVPIRQPAIPGVAASGRLPAPSERRRRYSRRQNNKPEPA